MGNWIEEVIIELVDRCFLVLWYELLWVILMCHERK